MINRQSITNGDTELYPSSTVLSWPRSSCYAVYTVWCTIIITFTKLYLLTRCNESEVIEEQKRVEDTVVVLFIVVNPVRLLYSVYVTLKSI